MTLLRLRRRSVGSTSDPRSPISRWGLAATIFVAGALISTAMFLFVGSRERARRLVEFERRATAVTLVAQSSFDVPLEVLRSVPALFDSSDDVTRAEFRAFVGGALDRYPWLYAVEWIPRVPGDQRELWEQRAAADGLAGYHFKQDSPDGGPPVPAEPRPEYFPLYYQEPPNEVALGIEETAMPQRRIAMERARDLGTTAVTERLKLVQDPPGVVSVIAFHPVFRPGEPHATIMERRASLRGFAAVVFRVRPVVERALHNIDPQRMDVLLLDVDASPPAILYRSRDAIDEEAASVEHVIRIGGRRWAVRVVDRAGWVRASGAGVPQLGFGLLASALVAALVHLFQASTRLRREVHVARRLGQYTLVELLGRGGMGTVYRAHHALLRRPTAVKLLDATDPSSLARFESEVQLTSSLTHPNTVVVYDYGHSPDGVFYYAMEYIEGITLQELVDHAGPQPPARVVHILSQVCGALAEAHAIGLVHRDIKPANVMLCRRGKLDDFVKVLDFGLAKDVTSESSTVSQSSTLVGTPLYLAPETVLHKVIDARTDLYALGAVAYFLLTGTPVFTGATVVEVCVHHVSTPPDPPSTRVATPIPPALEALILRCLAKDPADRPASADELAAALADPALARWQPADARRWWAEVGPRIEGALREARRREGRVEHESTLEVGRVA